MGDSFSWIRTVLMGHPEWRRGIDLDRDGVVGEQEQIQDTNQNGLIGDPGDWESFAVSNADALRNRVAFFGWVAPFKTDNPIHELAAIESELATPEEIKGVYAFAARVLRLVRERLADGKERSSLEKVQGVYSVMKEMGVRFIVPEDSLLATNVQRKVLDCDTSSFIVLAVAHEMGWPVSGVLVPEHFFVLWEGKGERFNVDFGESFDEDYYKSGSYYKGLKISPQAINTGVYLASQSRQQLRALFFGNRGLSKAYLGRHKEAIADYDQALRLDPNSAEAYNNRGNNKADLGDFEEAIADYDQGLRLDPNSAGAYYNRGNGKARLGRYEEAIADYTEALRLNPNSASAYNNRGASKADLGRYEEAIADYDQAIRLNPNLTVAYNNRGSSKESLGRHEEAIADYDQAIRLNPNSAEAYYNRGLSKKKLGRRDEAIADFYQARRLNP